MENIIHKLKSRKGICILCSLLFIAALALFLFLKIKFTPDTPEETTTAETTAAETTETTEITTAETTTAEETTTPEPETETVRLSELSDIGEGSLYGHLTCAAIGLDCPVYMGDSTSILRKGAGQIPATYLPGYGGLIMLGAHNNTYFHCLQYVNVDDIITLETSYGTYSYQVVSTEILDITGMSAYDFFTDHEQLLLYTCYPFDTLSHTDYRFMVHADLISGPSVVE